MSLQQNARKSLEGRSLPDEPRISSGKSSSELEEIKDKDLETAAPTPDPAPTDLTTFPEGGLQGWMTVAGCFLTLFCTSGTMQSFGVYENYYTLNSLSNFSPASISWIGSLQAFLLFGGGIFSGQLFDRGYFRWLMWGGSVLYVFSSFMLSLAKPQHYYQNFLAQGVGMGIGMGMVFLPSLSICSHYFRRRRAFAMGIVLSGGSLGAAISPILLNHLFPKIGFAWAVRAQSFMFLGLLGISNLIMKPRLPARVGRKSGNSSAGAMDMGIKGMLKDLPYMVCTVGSFFVFWGLFVPCTHFTPDYFSHLIKFRLTSFLFSVFACFLDFYLQLFCSKHDLPPNIVTYGITILNITGVLGRTLPNYFADHFGAFNVTIITSLATGSLVFVLLASKSVPATVVFAILYGFTSGGFASLIGPVAATFAKNINEVGTRMGFLSFFVSFALLTGSPISGALLHSPEYFWVRRWCSARWCSCLGRF
ncbi:major facilitator superfamily domain-containing protein [Rhodocollybia butyracea]|uniref:Major facilitator superfamily domain-containing protein n=1 Tax=Rhodocollybia butyracea TaxID=206335 RepID=A0A9P5U240_9AGAR|nr:major facilitator superfamily domain-containing protein [Rhodocollybia butyracea]